MKNSTLFTTIRQFTPKERQGLCAYVSCELFNRRPEVVLLCTHLTATANQPSGPAVEPEALFSAAFPAVNTYDYGKLRHTMSFLLEHVRQYLTLLEWQKDEQAQQAIQVRALRKRGLDPLFEKSVKKAEQSTAVQPQKDAHHHFGQYQILQEKLEYSARNERSSLPNLQLLPDQLTTYYVAEMLRHACTSLMYQTVLGKTYQVKLLDAILDVAREEDMLDTPAVVVYYHAYQMLQAPTDPAPFFDLKTALTEHETCFTASEMRSLYLIAINGCIRRMNTGQRQFIREAFEVYKIALDKGFLLENGYLSNYSYKNIIRIATALTEHIWAAEFAENYRSKLHPRERESIYQYNRAFLYYQNREYGAAMRLLLQTDLDDPLNNLHARRMLVCSYVELGEHQPLESSLTSFITYVKRKGTIGYHRDLNLRFVQAVRLLIKAQNPSEITKLRASIEAEPQIAEREWLLSKLVTSD